MSRIAILCPTKGRPELFQRLASNVHDTTSARVQILAYREDSDVTQYPDAPNVTTFQGTLWTVNEGMNHLVHKNRDFDIYGMVPDDAYPTVKDWDLYLESVLDVSKARALMTPHNGGYADMAFVTRAWIDAVGYYAAPFAAHYVWPTVIDILADCTGKKVEPDPAQIMFHHDHVAGTAMEHLAKDAEGFLHWCGFTRPTIMDRLKGLS